MKKTPERDNLEKYTPEHKIVLWIDANIKGSENQKSVAKIKKNCGVEILHEAKSVKEGIECLKQYQLRLIYVIVSGALCEDYMDEYEKNLRDLCVITFNIIYCGNKKYHDYKKFAYDKFFNPGGICTKGSEVINIIKKGKIPFQAQALAKGDAETKALTDTYGFSFSKVDKLSQLARPCMLGKFITGSQITEEGYKNFIKKVKEYKNNWLTYYAEPVSGLSLKVPYYLNTYFWLKMYSLNTDFYRHINMDLSNKGEEGVDLSLYDPMIYAMYMGLQEGYLKSYGGELWRGCSISANELKDMKEKLKMVNASRTDDSEEIALTVSSCKCFLSFSKQESVADYFVTHSKKSKELSRVKFKIQGIPISSSYFVSNAEIGSLSEFPEEEEVLVLPFSCFEVVDIRPDKLDGVTLVELKHLYESEKKIKNYIKWSGKDEVAQFLAAGADSSVYGDGKVASSSAADFFTKKTIVWIDQFASCEKYTNELKKYEEKLKENYQFYRVNSVKKGFNILKMHDNKLCYVIVSQFLAEEFFEKYKQKAVDKKVISANIILCENNYDKLKNEYLKKFKAAGFLNDPYLNPGGFVENFSDAMEYIFRDETKKKEITSNDDCEGCDENYDTTFILNKDENKGKNIRDNYFKGYEKPETIQKALREFAYFIKTRYKNDEMNELADPTEEKNILLPAELYATNFMKMYVSVAGEGREEAKFFDNMNMDLTQEEENYIYRYLPYIYTIYLGVNAGMVPNYKKALYRGGCLKQDEIDKLEENLLVWPKPFLTFFKKEDAADDWLEKYEMEDRGDCKKVKFILKEPKEGIFINNMDTGEFTRFKKDLEVVTLPFTPFIIKSIEEGDNDITVITMEYEDVKAPSFASGSGKSKEKEKGRNDSDSDDERKDV
ncbi:MAG: hypothetical protein MJ252_21095 [archaeon]|nr:hypothetical protein [archaeon]